MKIKESIKLSSSVKEVWEILKAPANMPAWNFKCLECSAGKAIDVGSTFTAKFQMRQNSRVLKSSCEVIEFVEFERITIRYSGEAFGFTSGYVDETFILISRGEQQMELKLHVDFSHSKMPLWLKCIIWFITTFGYKAGRSSLDGISDLVK